MNKLLSKSYFFFYAVATIHLIAILATWNDLIAFTKPLLLISLIYSAYLFFGTDQIQKTFLFNLLSAALMFSCLGDTALLFEKKFTNPLLFFVGLGSFLISHILYSILFIKISNRNIKSYWMIPYLVFLFLLSIYLLPGMEYSLMIPVIAYGSAITWMAWNSWRCYKKHNLFGFLVVCGSLFFIVSDSILAINRFKTPIVFENIIIMSTYIIAQYLISFGVVNILKHENYRK